MLTLLVKFGFVELYGHLSVFVMPPVGQDLLLVSRARFNIKTYEAF